MKCEECLTVLDQYVDDELDEGTARSLTAHMTTCGECAGAHEALRREQEIYASYLLDVEPPPHLWANLRLELEKEKASSASQLQLRLPRWLAMVIGDLRVIPQLAIALVLITIGLAIGLMVWRKNIDASSHQVQTRQIAVQPSSEVNRVGTNRDRGPANDNDRKILPASAKSGDRGREIQVRAARRAGRHTIETARAVAAVDQATRGAEQQYLSAIEILSRDIKRRRSVISPPLLSQITKALTEVDRNIAATRRAAREQPRDPVAVQYLALAYEKKVELLREVTSR